MHQQHPSSEGAELRIIAAGCSDVGRVREHNEDAIAMCEPPDQALLTRLGRLYLVADGAGGHLAGEVASRIAVETIAAVYYDQITSPYSFESMPRHLAILSCEPWEGTSRTAQVPTSPHVPCTLEIVFSSVAMVSGVCSTRNRWLEQ